MSMQNLWIRQGEFIQLLRGIDDASSLEPVKSGYFKQIAKRSGNSYLDCLKIKDEIVLNYWS